MAKKLKAVLTTLDDLEEDQKELYTEGDDNRFYLNVEGIEEHEASHSLKRSLQQTRNENKKIREERDKAKKKADLIPDDFTDEDKEAFENWLARRASGQHDDDNDDDDEEETDPKPGAKNTNKVDSNKIRAMYEARLKRQKDSYEAQIAAEKQEKLNLETQIASLVIDEGLTKALVDVGVRKELLKGAHHLLRKDVKVEKGDDGKPRAVVESEAGTFELSEYVQNWAEGDEGKPYIQAAQGTDSNGARRTSERMDMDKNPWKKGSPSYNLTEQGRLLREDPKTASRYKQAAGVSE